MNNLNIATRRIKFLGKTETMFQLCRGNDVIGVYCTREEAEAALAAAQ